ncbi:MAG: hypothetical protein DYG89_38255 [Caldilinea sp. CFX5]|nr:hypothetical protein [Caldilinea sp. CFX5]
MKLPAAPVKMARSMGCAMYFAMLRFIQDRRVPLAALVTHRFPIEQAPDAFTLFDSSKTGKVAFAWA